MMIRHAPEEHPDNGDRAALDAERRVSLASRSRILTIHLAIGVIFTGKLRLFI